MKTNKEIIETAIETKKLLKVRSLSEILNTNPNFRTEKDEQDRFIHEGIDSLLIGLKVIKSSEEYRKYIRN